MNYKGYTGNKLGHVDDYSGSTSPVGFQDKNNGGNDYTYDSSGNMISDYNKSITSITYNYLNLPNVISITSKGTITYVYDASGNKISKTTLDQTVTPNKTTTYYYAGDYVYRSGTADTLEFISHPEGRLRPVRIDTTQAISIANLKYIYDYYLKDHLGSVRSVLTTEQETDLYAATMEMAAAAKENLLFSNVSSTATAKPGGFDSNSSNGQVSQLNGNVNISTYKRVGPSIILKVMAGDTVSISTYGWYTGTTQPPATGVGPIVNDLLPLLTNGIVADGGSKGGAIPAATYNPLITAALDSFLQYMQPYDNTRPKAYLNWMVVDEEFAKVRSANHAGAVQVPLITGAMQAQQMIGPTNMVIRRNGYLYVYLSNESNQFVDFDNLVINHRRGPLTEQKDYYAFGMEIPGLSSQAFKPTYVANRNRYNGKELQSLEFTDSTSLNWDDYGARMYDPQIGRWLIQDKLADKMSRWSPYSYTFDNPITFADNKGNFPYPVHIRSFIPGQSIAFGFQGDNRGWSTAPGVGERYGSVTSRIQEIFTVDPSAKSIGNASTWSNPTQHPILGTAVSTSSSQVQSGFWTNGNNNIAVVTSNTAGSDPLIPHAPDIKMLTSLRLSENTKDGILNVQMTMNGNRYPSAEAFIGDSKGNQVFVGVSGYGGTVLNLLRSGNLQMMNSNFDIKINEKGEFQYIISDGQKYSIADWNSMVSSVNTYRGAEQANNSNEQKHDSNSPLDLNVPSLKSWQTYTDNKLNAAANHTN